LQNTMATSMRKMTSRALGLAAAAAIAGGAGAARAAEPGPDALPITVIAIQTNEADDQAEALTKALRASVRAMPGWSLAEGDYSLEVLTLSLKCPEPPDANCQSRIADQIKSDRYVWGNLKKKGPNVAGEVHLWVRGKGTSNWALDYSANLTEAGDESLKRIATEAISQLTGGPPKGGIHVRAGNVPGQVFIDGQPVGALKNGEGTFMAPAGPHKVTIKALGYADLENQVVVKPTGAPVDVNLSMIATGDGAPINTRRWVGFGAIGLGVVSAVVGIVSATQVQSAQNTIDAVRKNPAHSQPSTFDWCSSSNAASVNLSDACSKGKTFQTMEIVFFPLAAVAGGLGVYLVATSGKSAPKTGLVVNPQFGPGGGKLDLSYTW
jgi:hypothetical protein